MYICIHVCIAICIHVCISICMYIHTHTPFRGSHTLIYYLYLSHITLSLYLSLSLEGLTNLTSRICANDLFFLLFLFLSFWVVIFLWCVGVMPFCFCLPCLYTPQEVEENKSQILLRGAAMQVFFACACMLVLPRH